jgi:hypothetical protein
MQPLEAFQEMREEGLSPDMITYLCFIRACGCGITAEKMAASSYIPDLGPPPPRPKEPGVPATAILEHTKTPASIAAHEKPVVVVATVQAEEQCDIEEPVAVTECLAEPERHREDHRPGGVQAHLDDPRLCAAAL